MFKVLIDMARLKQQYEVFYQRYTGPDYVAIDNTYSIYVEDTSCPILSHVVDANRSILAATLPDFLSFLQHEGGPIVGYVTDITTEALRTVGTYVFNDCVCVVRGDGRPNHYILEFGGGRGWDLNRAKTFTSLFASGNARAYLQANFSQVEK